MQSSIVLLRQIHRWWRLHPRRRLSKARAHRSRPRNLPWRWVETMTSPTTLSDPLRAGSGNGASSGDRPRSGRVELESVKVRVLIVRAAAVSVVLLSLLLPTLARGDEVPTPWPNVFRDSTSVEVVNLEVFVRRSDGQPVLDLQAEDFALEVDGRETEVSNFFAVSGGRLELDVASAAEDGAPAETVDDALPRRLLVIYVDNANLTVSGRARAFEQLRDFLLEAWDSDVDALVASNGGSGVATALQVTQGLTSVPHEIFYALEQLQDIAPGGQRFDVEERQMIRALEEINVDAAAGFMEIKGDVEEDRSVAINQATRQAAAVLPQLRQQAQLRYDHVLQSLGVLRQVIDLSLGVPRRTSLLYVGDRLALRPGEALFDLYNERVSNIASLAGSLAGDLEAANYDATPEFLELVKLANSGGLTFYGLNASPSAALERVGAASTTGIWSPRAASLVERGRRESQMVLADGTGGRASRSASDVAGVLRSVLDDFNEYYSLGFTLPPGVRQVNEVKVRLRRSELGDLEVRTRRTLRPRSVDESMAQRALAALVLDSVEDPFGIGLEALATSPGDGGLWVVPLRLGIPLGRLVLVPNGPEHQAAVSVYVAARDDRGRTSKVLHHQCPIRIPNKELLTALGRSAVCGLQLQMRPGEQTVAVVVHDENAARTATARLHLNVGQDAGPASAVDVTKP